MLGTDTPLRRRFRELRRLISSPESIWQRALPEEVGFWQRYLETGGLNYPDEFRHRLDPNGTIEDPLLLEAIDEVGGDQVRILDVGSGPLTSVGFVDPRQREREIEVTAVDPLADQYDRLITAAGLAVPVRARQCRGEDLATTFPADHFDIAYARNSLDHAVEPLAAIQGMVRVTRPGGVVVLIHNRREGEAQHYEQLHQWNFDVQDGRLILFSPNEWLDVRRYLGAGVEVDAEAFGGPAGSWVRASIRQDPSATAA